MNSNYIITIIPYEQLVPNSQLLVAWNIYIKCNMYITCMNVCSKLWKKIISMSLSITDSSTATTDTSVLFSATTATTSMVVCSCRHYINHRNYVFRWQISTMVHSCHCSVSNRVCYFYYCFCCFTSSSTTSRVYLSKFEGKIAMKMIVIIN